eukprot:763670-Hanusia_phi.AAC.5
MKKTDELSVDISRDLDWGRDVISGEKLAPKFDSQVVIRKYSWVAHADNIKSLELVQAVDTSLASPSLRLHEPAEISCLLSSSYDHAVGVWDLQGNSLGTLRQGSNTASSDWKFPISKELTESQKSMEAELNMLLMDAL